MAPAGDYSTQISVAEPLMARQAGLGRVLSLVADI